MLVTHKMINVYLINDEYILTEERHEFEATGVAILVNTRTNVSLQKYTSYIPIVAVRYNENQNLYTIHILLYSKFHNKFIILNLKDACVYRYYDAQNRPRQYISRRYSFRHYQHWAYPARALYYGEMKHAWPWSECERDSVIGRITGARENER